VARVLIATGGVLLVVGLALGGYQVYLRYQAAVQRQQVDRYTAAIQRPAQLAGALVAETIVPELDAYAAGKVPVAKVAIDALAWKIFFMRTRAEFASTQHPDELVPIAQQFDHALAEYITAVVDIEKVAGADGPRALATGRAAAKRADCDYGRAAVALSDLRRDLSLPDVATFAGATTSACA
jgi:hypothetical protein